MLRKQHQWFTHPWLYFREVFRRVKVYTKTIIERVSGCNQEKSLGQLGSKGDVEPKYVIVRP